MYTSSSGSYSSYGSYSSMYTTTSAPMDIGSSSYLSRHSPMTTSSCAFPSWPRRSSLFKADREAPATAYLSDEDLCWSDTFEDDAQSVSSNSSASGSVSPYDYQYYQQQQQQQQAAQLKAQRQAAVAAILEEKERRRHSKKSPRRASGSSSSSSKKSPNRSSSKTVAMTPIAE